MQYIIKELHMRSQQSCLQDERHPSLYDPPEYSETVSSVDTNSSKPGNIVVSPDNTTKMHVFSWIPASHFMTLWGEVTWNTLASLPMKLRWNNPSAQRNCQNTRPVGSLFANL